MLVVVCGLPRSGSTLRYQIATALAERRGGRGLGWDWTQVRPEMSDPCTKLVVVKVHHPNPELELRLDPRGVVYGLTYRDLRDSLVSYQRQFGVLTPDQARAVAVDHVSTFGWFAAKHRLVLSRYETTLGDVAGEIMRYEAALDIHLSSAERAPLAASLSFESQRERSAALQVAEGAACPRTLLHPKHVADGVPGRWKTALDPAVLEAVYEVGAKWLAEHGYEVPDGLRPHAKTPAPMLAAG